MVQTLRFERYLCDSTIVPVDSSVFFIINFFVIILSIVSLYLTMNYITEMSEIYSKIRDKFIKAQNVKDYDSVRIKF